MQVLGEERPPPQEPIASGQYVSDVVDSTKSGSESESSGFESESESFASESESESLQKNSSPRP